MQRFILAVTLSTLVVSATCAEEERITRDLSKRAVEAPVEKLVESAALPAVGMIPPAVDSPPPRQDLRIEP